MAMFAVAAILPSLAVNPVATLSTSMGDIKVELFLDRVPRTASNFIDLAQSGEACRHHHLGNPPPPPMSTPGPVDAGDTGEGCPRRRHLRLATAAVTSALATTAFASSALATAASASSLTVTLTSTALPRA